MTTPVTPHDTIDTAELPALVQAACRAPSLHNSQPWRWTFQRGVLHLFADHRRVGHHTDITGSEVLLSCGAALDHLRVAAAANGWQTTVERYPDPDDGDHLAAVTFHRVTSVSAHERALGEAISQRRTDRLPFAAPEPWDELDHALRATLQSSVAELDVIDDSGRAALADASRRTEEHRRDDASYRYELLWWTHHSGSADGLPPSVMASASEASRVDIGRDFPTYGTGDRRPEVDRDHSKVLVLSTFDDSRDNTLQCGEALSRVLLECTAAGFATCTLTHMIEIHASREAVRRLVGRHAEPQVLIRVGRAGDGREASDRTPRRPVDEVLEVR
jgi:nitroreductase